MLVISYKIYISILNILITKAVATINDFFVTRGFSSQYILRKLLNMKIGSFIAKGSMNTLKQAAF